MRPRIVSLRIAGLLAVGHLLASSAFAAWPNTPDLNVPVCVATGDQNAPAIASDSSGSTFVAWTDNRSAGNLNIFAQKLSPRGVPLWTTDGVPVCTATGNQSNPVVVSDRAGGVIVVWHDNRGANQDLYAQRVNANGAVQWTTDGVALCTATGTQEYPAILADGVGGAIVAWQDRRTGSIYNPRIFAGRINGDGTLQWIFNGIAVAPDFSSFYSSGNQYAPAITSDGAGGAIISWYDTRDGTIDVWAQRVTGSGALMWVFNGALGIYGVPMGGEPTSFTAGGRGQWLISDGAGGAIATWLDQRRIGTGFMDFYARRIDATGTAQWPADGVLLGSVPFAGALDLVAASPPELVTDGQGGAIVAWSNRNNTSLGNILVQRVSSPGALLWTSGGVLLTTDATDQLLPQIVTDGFGGAVVVWQDLRATTGGIYARRVNSTGVAQWVANGVPVTFAVGNQTQSAVAAVGAGDVVGVWTDSRTTPTSDIYAQRISFSGCLGADEPLLMKVRDVPNDQGGKVRVSWEASCADAASPFNIDSYWIWRSTSPQAVQAGLTRGAHLYRLGDEMDGGRDAFLATSEGSRDYFWEYVASQPAGHVLNNSYAASTTSDSVAGSNPLTAYMVQARTAGGAQWWFSNPDSGYSVDNLGPAAPGGFTAQYFSGATPPGAARAEGPGYTWLHWSPNAELDFQEYRLHRGTSADFVPGPGNLLVAKPDTGYIDVGSAGGYYKLLSLDRHGNASTAALLTPADIVGVRPGAGALWLNPGIPNPSRGDLLIRFGLPRETRVVLRIYDASGRVVREMIDGRMPAGPHEVRWDAHDSRGRPCSNGIYVTRLEVDGSVLRGKFALAR